MILVRFHTPQMGQVGHTRWFPLHEHGTEWEGLPALDWAKVTAVETSEEMTIEQFRARYPEAKFPGMQRQ